MQGFVYLKEESEVIIDVQPQLPYDHYLKIGTFKINAHGTKLGERFIKKAFDHAIARNIQKLYVTVFSGHTPLIELFRRYGFYQVALKTGHNGTELVLMKAIGHLTGNMVNDYPLISLENRQYLLSIYPDYHTRLFPDSILNNENVNIINDLSHTNSIEKIYICKMPRVQALNPGDALIIYRTSDHQGSAEYRSVATSICMVEELKTRADFPTLDSFLNYCLARSVFSHEELTRYYSNWPQLFVIKMTYNAALKNRIIRKQLIEEVGLNRSDYWGFMGLSKNELRHIAHLGNVPGNLISNNHD